MEDNELIVMKEIMKEESINVMEGVNVWDGSDNDSGGEERLVDVQWAYNEDFDVDDELQVTRKKNERVF